MDTRLEPFPVFMYPQVVSMRPAIELITTGSELLNGRTVNRHAQTLAQQLDTIGLTIARDTTIHDNRQDIIDALTHALARVDIVVLSGGLGPTQDDITRETVAEWLGRKTVMHQPSLEKIEAFCAHRGVACTPSRARQALVVEGAEVLPNPEGAAPGECIAWEDKVIFLTPGPPNEFLSVVSLGMVPWLKARIAPGTFRQRIFMTCGIPEADMLTSFVNAAFPPEGIDIAYCAAPGRVEVRLSAATADVDIDGATHRLHELLGDALYAEERVSLSEALGRMLLERKKTVSTAESCTGGLIGKLLTDISGSSAYYRGGLIAYANEVKTAQLGVDVQTLAAKGAVSEEVAYQMAEGVRRRFQSDYGISTTGIAGPDGGTPDKPVGLVYIGISDERATTVHQYIFGRQRSSNREWTAQVALNLLRLRLCGPGMDTIAALK
ncbi:MAG: competence/damage-inducible protein A [Spartobacteria bacterium]|nr:competence/damage-inducible protein A [Spartobacteria bacterium]